MRRILNDFVRVAVIAAGTMLVVGGSLCTSCGEDSRSEADGGDTDVECGTLAEGDSDISGHPVLDGAFGALLAMRAHADAIGTELDESLDTIGAAWGVEGLEGMPLEDKVVAVKAEIEASVSLCVSGSLLVQYVAPECSSSIAAAQAAMLACEQGSGCDADDSCLENTAVECMGRCQGGCSGSCSGSCEVPVTAESCLGVCSGACETVDAGYCTGSCDGICVGSCCGTWSGDTCDGLCDGTCTGVCEQVGGMSCAGDCTGTCALEAEASCAGECHGSCDAECSDACQGDLTPPSCSAYGECEAATECAIPSNLWARAEVACAGAVIEVCYDFDTACDSDFNAKMDAFTSAIVPIINRAGENRDMFDSDAEPGIDAGMAVMAAAFEDLSARFEAGELDDGIAVGKQECVAPALEEASAMMAEMATDQAEIIEAELSLLAMMGID